MKLYLIIIPVIFFFSSCKTIEIPMGRVPEIKKPYIVTFDGTKRIGNTCTIKGTNIILDNQKFKANTLQSFSDGQSMYLTAGRSKFFELLYVGDINVYSCPVRTNELLTIDMYSLKMQTQYYVSKNNSSLIEKLTLKNAHQLLSDTDAGQKYLDKNYHSSQPGILLKSFLPIGLTGACFGALYLALITEQFVLVGLAEDVIIVTSLVCANRAKMKKKLNLNKAIARHNGVPESYLK